MTDHIVIIGGGPGGYEAAHVAAQLGAEVTVVDTDGVGGSAVLTDCVPSKTLIATAELMTEMSTAQELGVNFHDHQGDAATTISVDLGAGQRPGQAARGRPVDRHRGPPRPRRRTRRRRSRPPRAGPHRRRHRRPTASETLRGRRGHRRDRRRAPHAAERPARRRADPHVGAGLRPDRGAGEADRRRLGRHRRRVRQRLPRPSASTSRWSAAATGCCPVRTPTRRRCWRTCSPAAG